MGRDEAPDQAPDGTDAAVASTPVTKTCPRCAEEIKAAALVCHFCGHEFNPEAAPPAPAPPPPPLPRSSSDHAVSAFPPPGYPRAVIPPPGAGAPAAVSAQALADVSRQEPAPAKRGHGCLISGLVVGLVLAVLAAGGVYLYQRHEHAPMRTHYAAGIRLLEPSTGPADTAVKEALALNPKLGTSITSVDQLDPERARVIADIQALKKQRAAARAEFAAILALDDASALYRRGAQLMIDDIDASNSSMDKIVGQLSTLTPGQLTPSGSEQVRVSGAANALFWQKQESLLAETMTRLHDLD